MWEDDGGRGMGGWGWWGLFIVMDEGVRKLLDLYEGKHGKLLSVQWRINGKHNIMIYVCGGPWGI